MSIGLLQMTLHRLTSQPNPGPDTFSHTGEYRNREREKEAVRLGDADRNRKGIEINFSSLVPNCTLWSAR